MIRTKSRVLLAGVIFCLCISGIIAQDDPPAITADNADQVRLLGTFWQRMDEYLPYYGTFINWELSHTGQWLVSSHQSCRKLKFFQVWNVANLRMETQLNRSTYACRGDYTRMQFSPNDQYFAVRQCNNKNCGFQVWDLTTSEQVLNETVDAYSQDGTAVLSSGLLAVTFVENTRVQLYDLLHGDRSAMFWGSGRAGWRPKFVTTNPDESILAVQEKGQITLFQMPSGVVIDTIEIPQRIRTDMRFTADSRFLILEFYYSSPKTFWMDRLGEVITWDIEAGTAASHYALTPERTYTLTVSENANTLLLRDGNQIDLIRTNSGEVIARYADERIRCPEIASHPCAQINDDESLAVWISHDTIRVANLTDGSLAAKLPLGPHLRHMGFIPHTSVFVTVTPPELTERQGYPTCILQLWDASSGHEIGSQLVGLCNYFAISPDGTSIITADGQTAMIFGVPSATRQAYSSVPATVVPSAITVRTEPNSNADVIGVLSGVTVVGGIDPTGRYLYIPNSDGWIRADPSFIDLAPYATVDQLHVVTAAPRGS